MWSRARPCSFFVPDLRRRRAVPKKKPRRNGAKSNGRKYPNRGMALLSESEVLRKAVIAIPKGLWRPVVTAPHQLTAAGPEPNARARVDGLTLDGTASPSFPFRPADFAPASPCGRGLFFGSPRCSPHGGGAECGSSLWMRGRPRLSLRFIWATGVFQNLRQQPEQGRKIIEGDQAIGVDHGREGEDQAGHDGGPDQLAPEVREGRGARVAARHHLAALGLAAYSPGQDGEQRHPPDDEIDGGSGGPGHGVVATPPPVRPACRKSPWGGGTGRACHGRPSWVRRRPAPGRRHA